VPFALRHRRLGLPAKFSKNQEATVNELIETLLPILKQAGIDGIQVHYASPRPGDVRRNYSYTSKARQKLGWHARVTLPEGLQRTTQWFLRGFSHA